MGYSRDKIITWLNEDVPEFLSSLYNEPYINYRGLTTDTKEYYSNVIAKYLIDKKNKNIFNEKSIKQFSRHDHGREYWIERPPYDESILVNEQKRKEEWFAIKLIGRNVGDIGKIIKNQIPIKEIGTDIAGKIDLLAYKDNELLTFVELKWISSTETMLRAILEIYTYFCQINQDQLIDELKEKNICQNIKKINKAVLVFEESELNKHYNDIKRKNQSINDLAKLLEVDIYIIKKLNDEIIINKVPL